MKIVVTGGAGFIGSNFIINQINNTKNTIINFDKLTYAGNLENLDSIMDSKRYHFIKGDICDMELLKNTLVRFNPDSIVHFAAESHVDRSIENPLNFIQTNLTGTAVLLNAALNFTSWKTNKSFRFLHVSTDEVYGSLGKNGFFKEDSPLNPSSPYSASKAGSDLLALSWYKTYGFPILISNCSNNYGPYQFPEKLIPLTISNALDQKPLPIYGDGSNIRDWLFVDDHCEALFLIIKNGVIGETYNIGGNNEMTNIDIVQLICASLNELKPLPKGKIYNDFITYVKDRPGHDFRYAIDSSKIINNLNWAPKENFKSGINKTIQWYLRNESWWRNILSRTSS
jgi:dTDP-glucose 4,6-dehydratase